MIEQFWDDAFEFAAPLVARWSAPPGESDVLLSGAPEQGVMDRRIEFFPGGFQDRTVRETVFALQRFGHAAIDMSAPASHFAPFAGQLDTALLKGT